MKSSNRLEDYSAEEIREEVERGAHIVMYAYCVSFLVITFKRDTRPYLIKGGHSRLGPGLPWALLTLLFGWWGFPWGLIYTPMALWQTLRGGVDLTDAWIDDYTTRVAAAMVEAGARKAITTDGDLAPQAAPAQPFSRDTIARPPQPGGVSGKKPLLAVLGVLAVLALGAGVFGWFLNAKSRVFLVSGLGKSYTVTIDGTPHALTPFERKDLGRLPRGPHTVRAVLPAPGSPVFETTVTLGGKNTIGSAPLVVINPDQLAPAYEEKMKYGSKAENDYSLKLHPNAAVLELRRPDYIFRPFPSTISVKSGESRVRTRVAWLDATMPFHRRMEIIESNNGPDAAKTYLMRAGAMTPSDTAVLGYAQTLDTGAAREFFAQHLDTLPVIVNLHRYYQEYMSRRDPERDLPAEYRARLARHPGDGALLYLTGRLLTDIDESRRSIELALKATPPCLYAWSALAHAAQNEGRFEQALETAERGLKAVSDTGNPQLLDALSAMRRDMLVATGQLENALAETKRAHEQNPEDFHLAKTFFLLQGLGRRPEAEATAALAKFSREMTARDYTAESIKSATITLKACRAYGRGDIAEYINLSKERDGEPAGIASKIELTLSEGDMTAARALLAGQPSVHSRYWFLLQILASRGGDGGLATECFGKAVAELATEGTEARALGKALAGGRVPDAAALLRLNLQPAEKRVLACALGWRDAAARPAYFALAEKMNFDPAFPCRLLKQAMAGDGATARNAEQARPGNASFGR
jgi:tetratricopeptide (TPR) repeat protein